jgi:hypothetical protein
VSLPTLLTDAVVDGDIDLGVQLKGEDAKGREWVAPLSLTPLAAPPATALYRTPQQRHRRKEGKGGHETHSRGRGWVEEQIWSVYGREPQ